MLIILFNRFGTCIWALLETSLTPHDSQANRELLQAEQLRDGIARRAKPGQEHRQRLDARNRTISRKRARGEHAWAGLQQLGGKVVRAMTLARNELAITLKCVAYNVKRLVWLVGNDAVELHRHANYA